MGVPTLTIKSDDQVIPSTVRVCSVEIRRALNRIPEAYLSIADGSAAKRKFEHSDTQLFVPGRSLSIAVRHGHDPDEVLFEGLVVKHRVESRPARSALQVELKGAAFKLTRRRDSAVFRDQTDAQVIEKLVRDANLEAEVPAGGGKHPELVQFHTSAWDFLVSRADAQGLAVDAHRNTVSVRALTPDAKPKASLEHGLGCVELELELDAGEQWAEVTSRGWDTQNLAATQPAEAAQPTVKVGNLDAAEIARKLGGGTFALVHSAVLAQAELDAWAKSRLLRSRLSLLRGRATMHGRADLAPGDIVQLAGVGERFNGRAFVSGVVHTVDQDGWRTELHLGLAPEPFAREPDITDLPAGGLLPPVPGLHLGTVESLGSDPRGEHRVRVRLSMLNGTDAVWARCARPDAGKGRGQVFWPEPGDEVVVGFLNGDPREAILLGSLFGSQNTPPAPAGPPEDRNTRRAIVSKAGTVIGFDDDKPAVTIETPGKHRIVIDDDARAITLADAHGNTITLDERGITLKSATDLQLDAAGKVVIKGQMVDVQ